MTLVHLYQFSETDEKDPHSAKHSAHGSFEGCVKNRRSTDCLFLLLIIAMWIAMTVIGSTSVRNGDPFRLVDPIDYQGRICGYDDSVKNEPYFYTVMTFGAGVCVEACPTHNTSLTSTDPSNYYCLDSVYAYTNTSLVDDSAALSLYIQTECFTDGEFDIKSNCGCMISLDSYSVFKRCTFSDSEYRNQLATQAAKGYLTAFISDILQARGVVFGWGIGGSFVLAFIWVTLLRFECLALIFVWTSVLAIQLAFIAMTALAYVTANKWKDADPQVHDSLEIRGIQCLSAICLGVAIVWFVLMCLWRSAINLAVKTISLTAECIESMPLIVITPVVQVIGVTLFCLPWVFYCYFIASNGKFSTETYSYAGTVTVPIEYKKYNLGQQNEGRLWFMFFCFLWTVEFISAMGSLIISIAVAKWYFTKPDERGSIRGAGMLTMAYACALRFHAGTAAFGSLIVAIVEFTRWVVLYIEKHTKGIQNNVMLKWVFCCVQCCLWCLEKCLKFISKNAYCQTAIHGSSFCFAAKEAFFLICRNVFRVGALAVVSGVALFIGKVFVVAIVGAVTYYIFTGSYGDDLQGFAAPTILTMVIAYAVASMFTEVFETAVNCMLQCYISGTELVLSCFLRV
jgi:hypothetical protein